MRFAENNPIIMSTKVKTIASAILNQEVLSFTIFWVTDSIQFVVLNTPLRSVQIPVQNQTPPMSWNATVRLERNQTYGDVAVGFDFIDPEAVLHNRTGPIQQLLQLA